MSCLERLSPPELLVLFCSFCFVRTNECIATNGQIASATWASLRSPSTHPQLSLGASRPVPVLHTGWKLVRFLHQTALHPKGRHVSARSTAERFEGVLHCTFAPFACHQRARGILLSANFTTSCCTLIRIRPTQNVGPLCFRNINTPHKFSPSSAIPT